MGARFRCRDCEGFFEIRGTLPEVLKCPWCGHQWTLGTTSHDETTTDRAIAWLYKVAETLKEKGRKYGNSIDEPVRIFSKADKADGLAVRIDDKLARIKASEPDDTEDAEADLVGYIALRRGFRES